MDGHSDVAAGLRVAKWDAAFARDRLYEAEMKLTDRVEVLRALEADRRMPTAPEQEHGRVFWPSWDQPRRKDGALLVRLRRSLTRSVRSPL